MEKYLHKCLNTLIVTDEKMARLEVLVINDGSKDSSSQIAHEYEAKYPQTFRVIDKENGNYGSCINRGLKMASGKYIKVLDADDCFVNVAFSQFLDYLCLIDDDLVINDFSTVDENDTILETYSFDLPTNKSFTLKDIPSPMVEWLWHQSITYKTDVLHSINYRQTEGISYTDDEWVFKPMIAVHSVAYFPHIMYHYLLGREGQTFDPKVIVSSFDKRIVVGKSMVDFYSDMYDKCQDDVKTFMSEKLRRRLMGIYIFYLKMFYSKEGNVLLTEFDSYIKNKALPIYKELESNKDRFGVNFIESWRMAGCKANFYLKLKQFKFLIHKILSRKIRNLHMPDNLRRKDSKSC